MGFVTPWALAGLLAAGLPFLIHLMRRRDIREVPLPTLALLRRAEVRSRRRVRLVDLLLLLCRAAFLALIAVAVAEPYVSVVVAWGDGRRASVTIVMDDSMSMRRRVGGEPLVEAARRRARDVIQALPKGSEVAVVLAGEPARVPIARTEELSRVEALLDELPLTGARSTDLDGALALGLRELSGAANEERRLLVLSDFAQHAEADSQRWPQTDIQVELERIGPEDATPNRTISEALTVPDPMRPGRAAVQVEVRAFGVPDTPLEVSLRTAQRELATERVFLRDGVGRTTLDVQLPPDDIGATVTISPGDALPEDDERGVLLRAPPSARVLLVNGDPHPFPHEDEVGFLAKALDAARTDSGPIRYQVVDANTLGAHDLGLLDVVILANAPPPSSAVVQRLEQFVHQGGSLLVTSGHRVEPRAYGTRLGTLLPAMLGAQATGPSTPGLEAPGRAPGWSPPGGLEGVVTTRRILAEPQGPDTHVLLTFADGVPALLCRTVGPGSVAFLATSVDDDWSDLPYRPGFLPLLVQTMNVLSPAIRAPKAVVHAGKAVTIPLPPEATEARVMTPSGVVHDLDTQGREARFHDTSEPGAYTVELATQDRPLAADPRAAFVVVPPLSESELTAGPIPRIHAETESAARIEGSLIRKPVGPWLFLMAGLLMVAEGVIRRRRRVHVESG